MFTAMAPPWLRGHDQAMPTSRLTGVDHAWLRMHSEQNPMVITGFFVFEGDFDVHALREVAKDRLLRFSRFSQRVVEAHGGHSWQDVDIDLEQHVVVARIPEPSDEDAFREFVGELVGRPLDPELPLWRMTVLPNHPRGSAVFFYFHHALGDGVALMKVLLTLCDRPGEPPQTGSAGRLKADSALVKQVRGLLRSPTKDPSATIDAVRHLVADGFDLLRHPTHARPILEAGAPWAGAVQRLTTLPPDPKTLLKRPLSGRKRTAWSAPMPLAELKNVGRRHGVTLNDIVLTALVGGVRATLKEAGEHAATVRAMVPVNLRPAGGPPRLGNYFGLAMPSMPVGERDRLARLHRVRQEMLRIKNSVEPAVSFALLQGIGHAGAAVEEKVLRFFGAKSSLVMTNVPGPRETLELAGLPIVEMMFWVPQTGDLGLGLSVLSYAGSVRIGIMSDSGVLADPGLLLRRVEDELAALAHP
jgi:diacylglycerol O-acyltransferase / wax synthase